MTVSPAPSPFVKEMNDAGQFYANRVLKEWKEKDDGNLHVEWTRAWSSTLAEVQQYVKKNHTTGLAWNAKGADAKCLAGGGKSASLPPPPPPPPAGLLNSLPAVSAEQEARSALFADLNRGEEVTKGLKKVTADMQTHKNPELRDRKPVAAQAKDNKLGAAKKHPPKLELTGRKWEVEFHVDNPNIEVKDVESNQSVYVYKCEASTLKVTGKCNNIVLDGCKKVGIVFDDVVAAIEVVNCQSVQLQV